jgi:hypothetical protein
MEFTICYSFDGNRVVLELSADRITTYDAVYYSLVHSGVAFRKQGPQWAGDLSAILEMADRYGVTDVTWHRTIKYPHG